MKSIHIQVKARTDLKNILRHSIEHWGLERGERYYDDLIAGIESLIENPQLGLVRDDIKKGYRQLQIEKHILFYRISTTQIRIIRILHNKMLKAERL
jgi:toxin ParE1/3/4